MTDHSDEYYRRQAHDAEMQAQRAISPQDRATWLRLAQQWLGLIRRERARTASEAFDDAVKERGTHQDISNEPQ